MKPDWFLKIRLLAITLFLGMIAFRPVVAPLPVKAQGAEAYPFYIEPGVCMQRAPDGGRQVYCKVVVDLRNGRNWGFPTLQQEPYPVDSTTATPPVSHPFLLGKFAFSDTQQMTPSAPRSQPCGPFWGRSGPHGKIMPVLSSCFLTFKA